MSYRLLSVAEEDLADAAALDSRMDPQRRRERMRQTQLHFSRFGTGLWYEAGPARIALR